MAEGLGRLEAKVGLDTSGLAAGVARARGSFSDLDAGAAGITRSGGGLGRLLETIGRVGAVTTAAMGTAALAVGGFGLKVAADNEQAAISFETMLGSAEAASSFLTKLKEFAATTPFELPELQTAATSLISVGVAADDVIPIMTTLGNVTSGMGTGSEGVKRATVALQQMSAAGRITGEDLNQLRDAGIPVFDLLAGATGKTKEEVSALAREGKLGKAELDQLFESLKTGGAGLERFSGLMEKQSQSLSGMLSTLKDTVGQGLAGAMEPAVDALKAGLPQITTAMGGLLTQLGPVLNQIIGALAPALGPVLELIGALAAAMGPVIAVVAKLAGSLATALAPVIKALAPVIATLAEMFGEFLLPIINQLAPVLEDLAKQLSEALLQALAELRPHIPALAKAFGDMAIATLQLLPAIIPLIPLLAQILSAVLPLMIKMIEWQNFMRGIMIEAVTLLVGALVGFLNFVVSLPQTIGAAVGAVRDFFVAAWNTAREAVVGAWQGIVDTVSSGVEAILSFIGSLPGRIANVGGDLFNAALELGSSLLRGLVNGVSGAVEFVGDIAEAIGDAIRNFINVHVIDRVNNALEFEVGAGPISFSVNPPDIPRLHSGGIVPGPRGAEVLAMLQAGERVLSLAQVDALRSGGSATTPAPVGGSVVNNIGPIIVDKPRDIPTAIGRTIRTERYLAGAKR